MAVQKLFWQDPYLTACSAAVTHADGPTVTLDRTILFAFSGGQQSDSGAVNGFPVLDARKDGRELFYRLPDDHSLRKGDSVHLTLDWEKRYRLMRLHFAAELVLETVYRECGNPERIGASITRERARVDFFFNTPITPFLPLVRQKVTELIRADLPIVSAFQDEAAEDRYWEIAGFAKVACGGTHPRRTGEIGEIRLQRENPGKGKERVAIYLEE